MSISNQHTKSASCTFCFHCPSQVGVLGIGDLGYHLQDTVSLLYCCQLSNPLSPSSHNDTLQYLPDMVISIRKPLQRNSSTPYWDLSRSSVTRTLSTYSVSPLTWSITMSSRNIRLAKALLPKGQAAYTMACSPLGQANWDTQSRTGGCFSHQRNGFNVASHIGTLVGLFSDTLHMALFICYYQMHIITIFNCLFLSFIISRQVSRKKNPGTSTVA